jgi:hypothetical protein
MILELNLEYLYEFDLTPSQYIFLTLLNQQQYNTADKMVMKGKITTNDRMALIEKGYLLNTVFTDSQSVILSKGKMALLFQQGEIEYFWELFSTYPIKVSGNNRGGTRILRPSSHDAKETKACKKKYEAYLGKDGKARHEHVMKCLDAELNLRRKDNSLGYMKNLVTYLNQQSWFSYEALIEAHNI